MISKRTDRPTAAWPVVAHVAFALSVLVGLALAPPARGKMLILPLGSSDRATVARLALAEGAQLIGVGALPRSLVVAGDAGRLFPGALAAGMLVLRAPAGGCIDGTR